LLDDLTVIFIGDFLSGVLRGEIVCGVLISVLSGEIRCHLCLLHVLVVPLTVLAITVLILLLVDVEANHEEADAVD
jgi:quinol-cytochrome oxidoreductase complex cytochrome b subunit